jgi:hypothetical protein
MPGAVIFVVAMVVVVPVAVMLVGALWSAVFDWLATNAAEEHPGGEG